MCDEMHKHDESDGATRDQEGRSISSVNYQQETQAMEEITEGSERSGSSCHGDSHSSSASVTVQVEEESLLPEHEVEDGETNGSQEKHFTPDEDTSNNIRPKAQPITAGELPLLAIVKCQPTSLIIPVLMQVEAAQDKTPDANYDLKDQFGETIEDLCTSVLSVEHSPPDQTKINGVSETVIRATSSGSSEERCDNFDISVMPPHNLEANEPDKDLPSSVFSTDPERPHKNVSFEGTSSEYKAACQVLGEIIDEAISKIELTTQEKQGREFDHDHCYRSCTVSYITGKEDEAQDCVSETPKLDATHGKAQLNVSFASPVESRRIYTPSPSLSSASTMDITPEIDAYESEEVTSDQVTSFRDVKSDSTAFKSMCDSHDQSPIASEDNYSDPVIPNSFPTTELNDNALLSVNSSKLNEAFEVQSNLDEDNVMPGQINHVATSAVQVMSEEKLERHIRESDPSEKALCGEKSKEIINREAVETDYNSYKTKNSYETIQISPRDCKIHYPTKQMLQQDMISSSCDLFDSIDSQQKTHSAGLQTAASVHLFSPSSQVSTKLSCHGNEMENQKQSDNSDLGTTHKSTRDLPVPDLDGRESPVVNTREAKNIVHRRSDQSTKFALSAELFSQTPDCGLMGPLKASSNAGECQANVTERSFHYPWQHNFPNLSNTEPYQEIVKLIFDHPYARCSPPKANQMTAPDEPVLVPIVKPEAMPSEINDSYLDNKHTNETPINTSDPQEEENCGVESPKLAYIASGCDDLFRSDSRDNGGTNQIYEVNIREENTPLTNSLADKCHANKGMDSSDGIENIGEETTTNNTAQLRQNAITNGQELFVVETSPIEEVRKIDGNYAQENHLIDGHIGSSVKDSTQRTSSEWPITEGLMNVSYQSQQRHPDCYLTANPKNKMTNEMCVSPMQIKANELQTVPVGLSAVQENFLEEINPDSLPQTSMPSSKKDLLPQMTVTRQSTQQWPTESIPLKLDQSSTHELKCTETTSLLAKSEYPVCGDRYEETTVQDLPGIQCSNPTIKGSQDNSAFKETSNEVISQDLQNIPIVPPAQIVQDDDDDDFPDSGISNSSQSHDEVVVRVNCIENRFANEMNMCLKEVPQFPQDSRLSVECSVNATKENIDDDKPVSNCQSEVEQLVNILVNAICGKENVSQPEESYQIETGEKADDGEVALHLSEETVVRKEEIDEFRSPKKKMRKLEYEISGGNTPNNDDDDDEEIQVEFGRDSENKSQVREPTEEESDAAEHLVNGSDGSQNDAGVVPSRPSKDVQTEHLPLKKRSILHVPLWSENEGASTEDTKTIRCEMEKLFPAPSQPQYMLFDANNDSSSEEEDDEVEQPSFWLNSLMASQPQYNLLDCANIRRARAQNSTDVELQRELNLLRQPSFFTNGDPEAVTATTKPMSDDQQVPAVSPTKQLIQDQTSENTMMYPKLPDKKIVYPKRSSGHSESSVNAESSTLDVPGENSLGGSFRWKGTTKVDYDSVTLTADTHSFDDACVPDVPAVIPRLQPCYKPVRVGLSRRQRVTKLHPYWKLN